HGVGMLKKSYLGHSRSESEIRLMKSVKSLFDPMNIMNPGKIFDLP
ncbi:MAG: FAD-linked oxidase C-terminal domain-containing protein, partial [Pseudomonadota bacterium]